MPARGYELYLRVHISSRYRVEHEKIKFLSTSGHVIFCSLHKHTKDVFDDFPKISEGFPKLFRGPDKRPRRTFSEDCRRLPKIFEEEPMMFRSYSNTSEYLLMSIYLLM